MEVRVNNMTKLGFQEHEIEKAKKFAKNTSIWAKNHQPLSEEFKKQIITEREPDDLDLEI